jgi:hypothetical protein
MKKLIMTDEVYKLVEEACRDTAEDWCALLPDINIEPENLDEYHAKGTKLQEFINSEFKDN